MKSPTVLEVDSVRHSISGRRILSDVYLKAGIGEVIGILGRNGTGKSTLLKIIFGTLSCESSHVRLDRIHCPRPFATRSVSYLPQSSFLPPSEKVATAIDLFLGGKGTAAALKSDERIAAHLGKKVRDLSGGLRRYLEVGLILNLGSSFVLLDEPFSGIEPVYREQIKEWVRTASKSKAILVTDHDYLNIMDMSTRLVLISQGRLIAIKDPEELKEYHFLPAKAVLGTPGTRASAQPSDGNGT